jgi:hypothetical protein
MKIDQSKVDEIAKKVAGKLLEVFGALAQSPKLNFIVDDNVRIATKKRETIFEISKEGISIPFLSFKDAFFARLSPLPEAFVEIDNLKTLIKDLSKRKSIVRFNHLGFCYQVDSVSKEKERIFDQVSSSLWTLYREPNNSGCPWYFVGELSSWDNPVLELIPIGETGDQWKDYWLPHIQVDVDTSLSAEELKEIINRIFRGQPKPIETVNINGRVFVVRIRLGLVAGINIDLDFATNLRNTQKTREKWWRSVAEEKVGKSKTAACGLDCGVCGLFLEDKCLGCIAGTEMESESPCDILTCAWRQKVAYCPKDCRNFPCDLFYRGKIKPFTEGRLDYLKKRINE